MLRRSIPRHCREKHTEEIVSAATFVDDIKGICAVRKSTHGGVGYPCHEKRSLGQAPMKSSYWNVRSNSAWIFLMLLGVVA